MALRRFRGASSTSTVVFTGQAFVSRELLDTGSATGSNGSSVTLAAGASASFYLISPTGSPNLTTSVTGSWEASLMFQSVTPTNIFCKFRVHRISVAGTVPTILASTEYSAEVQARRTNTPYIISTDATDLGTFSSGHRIAVEWTIRNAGGASISPQPSFGTYGRFVRTPIESTTAVGWTALDRSFAGYRPVSYSEGAINGVKRTGSVRNTITSSGTATGTKGGQNFSGSVTGVSTSTGTAIGAADFRGLVAGSSTSIGTIAAGKQGYSGSVSGNIISSGFVNGTPGPQPEPGDGLASSLRLWNQFYEEPQKSINLFGRTKIQSIYSFGNSKGTINADGFLYSSILTFGVVQGAGSFYSGNRSSKIITRAYIAGITKRDIRANRDLMLIMEEI